MKERQIADLNKKKQLVQRAKPRAVFHGDFRKHSFLKTYICPGNENQEDENFEAFLDLVLRESDTIKGIEIIDTTELYQRHYNKTLPNFKTHYQKMIEKKLGKGENAVVQWKITSWADRINTGEYQQAYRRVLEDFQQNRYNLVTVLANTVRHYKKINGEEAANNYGLEELAEFATQKGAVVFPGKLNGILKWGLRHYEIPVNFISYKFKEITLPIEELSSCDKSVNIEAQTPNVLANHSHRFFSPANENCKSLPLINSSSTEAEDDETALLIKTVGFYAVKAKERIKQQHQVDGYQAQLIFLQGYLDYCQRAGTNYQVIDAGKTNQLDGVIISEKSSVNNNILPHKL